MGHKSTKMTMRYAHHNPESLRPAVEALEKVKSSGCYNSATVAQKEEKERFTISGQSIAFFTELSGRPGRFRTADLYRVKVALSP